MVVVFTVDAGGMTVLTVDVGGTMGLTVDVAGLFAGAVAIAGLTDKVDGSTDVFALCVDGLVVIVWFGGF